jgi:hypothetical protein
MQQCIVLPASQPPHAPQRSHPHTSGTVLQALQAQISDEGGSPGTWPNLHAQADRFPRRGQGSRASAEADPTPPMQDNRACRAFRTGVRPASARPERLDQRLPCDLGFDLAGKRSDTSLHRLAVARAASLPRRPVLQQEGAGLARGGDLDDGLAVGEAERLIERAIHGREDSTRTGLKGMRRSGTSPAS